MRNLEFGGELKNGESVLDASRSANCNCIFYLLFSMTVFFRRSQQPVACPMFK